MVTGICRNLGLLSRCSQHCVSNLQTDTRGPGRRLTKIQATSSPDHVWPEIWSGVSKAAQRKQQGAFEKPRLDNAGKLRGICFVDPEDVEFKETMTNARTNRSRLWNHPRLKPSARRSLWRKKPNTRRPKCACIVEAHESTRQRTEKSPPQDHEDRIAAKGFNSSSHCNLVHTFILLPQAMKIPHAKAAVGKEWEKCEKLPIWQMNKVKSKKEVILEAPKGKRTVQFVTLMYICHLKNAE